MNISNTKLVWYSKSIVHSLLLQRSATIIFLLLLFSDDDDDDDYDYDYDDDYDDDDDDDDDDDNNIPLEDSLSTSWGQEDNRWGHEDFVFTVTV